MDQRPTITVDRAEYLDLLAEVEALRLRAAQPSLHTHHAFSATISGSPAEALRQGRELARR